MPGAWAPIPISTKRAAALPAAPLGFHFMPHCGKCRRLHGIHVAVVIRHDSFDNCPALVLRHAVSQMRRAPMDIFEIISATTFWRVLLFLHFVMAVGLLAAVSLQLLAVLAPAPVAQPASSFVARVRATPPRWYVAAIIILYVPTFLLGAWVYIKY